MVVLELCVPLDGATLGGGGGGGGAWDVGAAF